MNTEERKALRILYPFLCPFFLLILYCLYPEKECDNETYMGLLAWGFIFLIYVSFSYIVYDLKNKIKNAHKISTKVLYYSLSFFPIFSIVILGLCFACFVLFIYLGPIYCDLLLIYNKCPLITIISVFVFVSTLISFLLCLFLRMITGIIVIPIRNLFLVSLFFSTIVLCVDSIVSFFMIIRYVEILQQSIVICLFGVVILCVTGLILGENFIYTIHFLVYSKKQYALFLRSFAYDEKETEIWNRLDNINLPILKIGNPKNIFPYGIGDTFFLPTSNWKKQINFYVKKATVVICVVDSTEGVLWEMLNYIDESNKFIYYISNRKSLQDVINKIDEKLKSIPLMMCVNYILSETLLDKVGFCIVDNRFYYSEKIYRLIEIAKGNIKTPLPSYEYTEERNISKKNVPIIQKENSKFNIMDYIIRLWNIVMTIPKALYTVFSYAAVTFGKLLLFFLEKLEIFSEYPVLLFIVIYAFLFVAIALS